MNRRTELATSAARGLRAAPLALLLVACGPAAEPSAGQPGSSQSPSGGSGEVADVAALRAELESSRARALELEAALAAATARTPDGGQRSDELARLRGELARAEERRLEREREWLRFLKSLDQLGLPPVPAEQAFVPELPPEELPAPPEPVPIDEAKLAREAELARSLRALLAVEGLRSLDLLEAGHLGAGWIGPVVFRLLDDRGRLAGSLFAERLRLEGSRAARTLALVLESGYEMRGGERVAFAQAQDAQGTPIEGGARRIELVDIDPTVWAAPLGELFGASAPPEVIDDGRWNALYVKGSLNRLLKLDAANGYWRLKSLGGVLDGVLREVHLEGFDASGKLERRLFADALRIVRQEKGLVLELERGAQMRGDEKVPFLDGRFRIFLPRAVHAEWERAELPGLTEPKDGVAPRSG